MTKPNKYRELLNTASRLHKGLSELVRLYQFRDRTRICCHDISVTQCYAIETLVHSGTTTLKHLAAELYLNKSTASRVIDSLVSKGYALRDDDEHDGRAVALRVTPAGRKLYRKIESDLIAETAELMSDISPEAQSATLGLIDRLVKATTARFRENQLISCDR